VTPPMLPPRSRWSKFLADPMIVPRAVWARLLCAYLHLRNLVSSESAVGDSEYVVSMTSFGERIARTHLALESIARGSQKPRRLILWLADDEPDDLPSPLKRLQRRGVEILRCPDWRSHKKFFPYCFEPDAGNAYLVTADDDVLYSRTWLEDLVSAASPSAVACHRARVVRLEGTAPAPYGAWDMCDTDETSYAVCPVGGGGVIYPPRFVRHLAEAGDAFVRLAPTSDDLWLHHLAVRHGFPARQVSPDARWFPGIPARPQLFLFMQNAVGANDAAIRDLYGSAEIARIRSAVGS
jgi:hypothetical protein